jgi:ligand-binding sensor domain-containing protein/signal transduction histidine kinase
VTLLLLCLGHTTYALDPGRVFSQYIRDQWGSAKGFPGGQVYAITQTSDGYIWIGAEKGLVRFDGINFHLFQHANTPAIPVGPIRNLVADSEGGLWIYLGGPRILRYANSKFEDVASLFPQSEPAFTAMGRGANGEVLISALVNGTLRYTNGKFVKLARSPDLPNFLVISLAESPDGKLWIGTRDLGLFYSIQGNISSIGKPLPDRKINCLLPVTNEELWIGTDSGVVRWNGVDVTTAGLSASLTHVQVLTMIRDREANVWVGTNKGLIRVSPQGSVAFSKREGDSVPVTALFEDREGNIWSGTSQGIERLRDSVFVTYSASEGIPAGNGGPVYVDSENRVWFGPAAGGLYWLNRGQVQRVPDAGLSNDVIYSITGDKTGLWIGRQKGGLTHLTFKDGSYKTETYTGAQGLAQNSVYAVNQNRDGSVWAGTLSGGVSQFSRGKFTTYTTSNGLASNSINAILESADETMWFATPDGLSALSNGRWQTLDTQHGLPSNRVNCLFEDAAGLLWVGTDDGLAFFDSGRFQTPTVPASLHEQILGLVADGSGALWIATTNHVLRVTRDNLRNNELTETDVREFGVVDGLPASEGVRRSRSVIEDRSGRVWFSLSSGLSVVDPGRLRRSSVPAIIHITSLEVEGSPIAPVENVLIPAGRQRIAFNFVGLSLAIPERVKYRYRLDNFDHDWSNPVSLGEAIYTNLGPGSYRFRVIASNSDGTWNSAEQVLGFRIAPAFWQTWWFRVSAVLAFALTLLAIYRIHLLQVTRQLNMRFEERLAERTRIAQELHDTLLQGFLSASMQLDVAVDQLPESSSIKPRLTRILDLMRQVHTEGRNALRGLRLTGNGSQDIALALSNISQELKGAEDTTFKVIVEGSSRPLLPIVRDEVYRIGREAVINAFHHARAKSITVEISYLDNQLRLLVTDDGCGINSEVLQTGRDGHWGLSGMRERAERIKARLKLRSRVGSGTEVELSVPGKVAFQDKARESGLKWFTKFSGRNSATAGTSKEVKQ